MDNIALEDGTVIIGIRMKSITQQYA